MTLASVPVLYSFRRCPYAIRARLALQVSGIPIIVREVDLRHKPSALLAISPKATVPVLALPDGSVLEESLGVMRWALSCNDPQGWLLSGEAPQVQALVDLNDGPFKHWLDRYKYAERFPERPADFYRDAALAEMLVPLEERLTTRRWLLRDTPSIADVALFPFVRQFAAVDPEWFDHAPLHRLRQWLQAMARSELFRAVMQKRAVWQPGAPEAAEAGAALPVLL